MLTEFCIIPWTLLFWFSGVTWHHLPKMARAKLIIDNPPRQCILLLPIDDCWPAIMATKPVKYQRRAAPYLSIARSFCLFCLDAFRAEGISSTKWIKGENVYLIDQPLNSQLFVKWSTDSLPYLQPLHAPKTCQPLVSWWPTRILLPWARRSPSSCPLACSSRVLGSELKYFFLPFESASLAAPGTWDYCHLWSNFRPYVTVFSHNWYSMLKAPVIDGANNAGNTEAAGNSVPTTCRRGWEDRWFN